MRKFVILLPVFLLGAFCFGQTADEYVKKGLEKCQNGEYALGVSTRSVMKVKKLGIKHGIL
jgi:hypothetical protein